MHDLISWGASQMALVVKNPPSNAGNTRDVGSIPGLERSPEVGNGNSLSILAWKIPWIEEPGELQPMELQSWTWLSDWTYTYFLRHCWTHLVLLYFLCRFLWFFYIGNHAICKSGQFIFFFPMVMPLFLFFPFIFIRWRLITLQYCSGFCHTLTWISHGFTCVPHPEPPSHLSPHPIPLGHPSTPAPSTCLMHPTWTGDLFHTW